MSTSKARSYSGLLEALGLGVACLYFIGLSSLEPGAEVVGSPTRDLFDHVALLDMWSLEIDEWAAPDGGTLVPPDLFGMLWAWPALEVGADRAVAYNFSILMSLLLACAVGWGLGRRMGNAPVGAVAFGLSPYLLGQTLSGETETVCVWPLGLMVLLLQGRTWLHWVGAGAAGAVAAVGSWYHGAFAGLVLAGWLLVCGRLWGAKRDLRVLSAPVTFGALVLAPAVLYARVLESSSQLFRGPTMQEYITENPRALAGMVGDPAAWLGSGAGGANHVDGLGLLLVALAIWGGREMVRARDPSRWFWFSLLGAGLVLSLGPSLHFHGADTGIPLPGRLLAELPFVGLMRLPHRWLVVASIALAALAAKGAARLPRWAAVFVALEAMWFYVPERPTVDITSPDVHAELDGTVLDLPPRTLGDDDRRGRYLVWQRSHGFAVPYALLMQPLGPTAMEEPLMVAVAALDSRDPIADRYAEASQFRSADFARAVARARRRGVDAAVLTGAADRLRAMGIQNVVLHQDVLEEADAKAIYEVLEEILGAPDWGSDDAPEQGVLWRL